VARARRRAGIDDADTRARVLEAAGRVFASRGFDRATGREICDLARTHPSTINYHFRGMEALYSEVLRAAHSRVVVIQDVRDVAMADVPPEAKLANFVRMLLRNLLLGPPDAWPQRVFMREMASPTGLAQDVVDREIAPKAALLRGVVSEVMSLPPDHVAVGRSVMSLMTQATALFQMRDMLARIFPAEYPRDEPLVEAHIEHLIAFNLAGMKAVAASLAPAPAPRRRKRG
jgi:TetR/AcrR family transcriptional regulator, regulator of cefoperazone and chloramphenicol sensitivity